MQQKEDPNQITIVEFYADNDAYQSHLKTAHFQRYKATTLKMVKSLKLIDMGSMEAEMMQPIFRKVE